MLEKKGRIQGGVRLSCRFRNRLQREGMISRIHTYEALIFKTTACSFATSSYRRSPALDWVTAHGTVAFNYGGISSRQRLEYVGIMIDIFDGCREGIYDQTSTFTLAFN